MEDLVQTSIFAWICTVFAHLIHGYAIQYPKLATYAIMSISQAIYTRYRPFIKLNVRQLALCSDSPNLMSAKYTMHTVVCFDP